MVHKCNLPYIITLVYKLQLLFTGDFLKRRIIILNIWDLFDDFICQNYDWLSDFHT